MLDQEDTGAQADHEGFRTMCGHIDTVVYTKLNFSVDNLFTCGSPIAVFLMLGGASSDKTSPLHGLEVMTGGWLAVFRLASV